jgi:putative ABC transport system permease protein
MNERCTAMFDLEKEIKEWKRKFHGHASFEDGLVADMELHLRDNFAELKEQGLSDEEAFQRAVEQTGTAERIAAEYHKNRELALDRRTPWRPARFMPALAWNYIKAALRKLRRQKGYAFINIFGLAVGIACSTFIFLYVSYELSFDRYHKDYQRIFRVGLEIKCGAGSSKYAINVPPLAPRLNENFSGVEKAARLCFLDDGRRRVKKGEEIFYEEGFVYVDPEIFSILSYDFTEGNPDNALQSPRTVVLPQRLAEKYFPHEHALGKILNINNQDILVTGVVKTPPVNSHLTSDVFLPMTALGNPRWLEDWTWPGMLTFVKLAAGADARIVEGKMEHFCAAHYRQDPKAQGKLFHHFLQPLAAVYLHSSDLEYNFGLSGNPTTLFIFSAVGLFILLIACINFINLATAQAAQRAKEVGVRKVAGAGRRELIGQFMSEAWLTAMQAMLLALGLMIVGRPLFNTLTTGFELPYAAFWSLRTLLIVLALTSAMAVLAGGYPAFYLSAIQPASVFKGGGHGSTRSLLRKTLVIVQFAVSVTLGIGTIIIFQQLHFMQNKNLGFQKGQKIILQIQRERGQAIDWEMLKNIFSRRLGISATASANVPGWGAGSHQTKLLGEGDGEYRMMFDFFFDADFPEVYGMKLAAGRLFNGEMPSDAANTCLLNEAAVAAFGWNTPTDAIGKRIETGLRGRVKSVIGVVKDFHYRGVQHRIEPLIMEIDEPMFGFLTLDLKTGNIPQTLAAIKDTWRRQFPSIPFDYVFLDRAFAELYLAEQKAGQLATLFTALGLFIACLGLLGLTSFLAQQRTKEIGIRKTLGASTAGIVSLLIKDFSKWVSIGALTACPLTLFFIRKWLQEFPYRITLSWWPFAVSILLALLTAVLTMIFHAIRAARSNPVDSLRYE